MAGNKTRQVVTGNSSNSVGLSITVSMFLEAFASSIDAPYEVNSSEEMMAVIEGVNDKWIERNEQNSDIGQHDQPDVKISQHEKVE